MSQQTKGIAYLHFDRDRHIVRECQSRRRGNFRLGQSGEHGPDLKLRDLPLTPLIDDRPTPFPMLDLFLEGVSLREPLLYMGAQ